MPVLRARTHRFAASVEKHRELAWAIADVAADPSPVPSEIAAVISDRLVDQAARAAVSLSRDATVSARSQAAFHPARSGATIYGHSSHRRFSPEWAAWANLVAIRDRRRHDTPCLGTSAQTDDLMPPILAVAQHCECTGSDLIRGIATAAEVQIALTRGAGSPRQVLEPMVHLAPALAAGIGAMLSLPVSMIDRAIRAALAAGRIRPPTRDLSRGKMSASAFASKAVIEAIDLSMRTEAASSSFASDGEDALFEWMLCDAATEYEIVLPARGTPRTAIRGTGATRRMSDCASSFRTRTADIIPDFEQDRFLNTVERLPRLSANDLFSLTFSVPPGSLPVSQRAGLFDGRSRAASAPRRPAPVLRLVEPA